MVLGFTDTECRIAGFRYRELHAEADRQRQAASAAPISAARVRSRESIPCRMGAAIEQVRQILLAALAQKATDHTAAPGTLVVH
jgi:hypothetical protein